MRRRDLLRASGAGLLAGVAGCTRLSGGSPGDATPEGTTASGSREGTEATVASRPSIDDHPAAAGLRDQPRKGDLDGDVVVVFEDPSCPSCRDFEEQTVPKILSELVEPGAAAFVYRGYPIVYPWGETANHALEATYDRDADAFWALKDRYFDEQSAFDGDNVLDRTEQFLDDETDVDGAAVVEDVRNDAYADAVQADIDAGEAADVNGTPTSFLFRDGRYLTKAAGSVSFEIFLTAFGD